MRWKRLVDHTEELSRGTLTRCVLEEGPTILFLREDETWIPLTGQDVGTAKFYLHAPWSEPRRSPKWLVENWERFIPCPVEDVLVREYLDAHELDSAPRVPITEYDGTIERGCLIECPFGYPFEGRVYMMVTDYDLRLSIMPVTGYKAGIRAFWVLPPEAGNDTGLDARWLVANASSWMFDDARVEGVFVRDSLRPDELM